MGCRHLSFAGGKVPAQTQFVVGGKSIDSTATKWIDVHNPATNQVVTQVPQNTNDEMNEAVANAKAAYATWSKTSPLARQQIMFKYQALIKENLAVS